jgi:hypothetical protein
LGRRAFAHYFLRWRGRRLADQKILRDIRHRRWRLRGGRGCHHDLRRGWRRCPLVPPTTIDEHIPVASGFPSRWHVDDVGARRQFPAALDPDVAAIIPSPVARNPDVSAGRPVTNHLMSRLRRSPQNERKSDIGMSDLRREPGEKQPQGTQPKESSRGFEKRRTGSMDVVFHA